jgi:hypothetical protein
MTKHANAQVTEVDASHVSMVSHPDAIVEVIRTAVAHVREAVTA